VLRIHELGFPQRIAEKACVELVEAFEDRSSLHIGWIRNDIGADTGIAELCVGEKRDRLDAIAQIIPECIGISRAGETASHPDDGNPP
jgi:hypothetical protein